MLTYVVAHGIQVGFCLLPVRSDDPEITARQAANTVVELVKGKGWDYAMRETQRLTGQYVDYQIDGDITFELRVYNPKEHGVSIATHFLLNKIKEAGCP